MAFSVKNFEVERLYMRTLHSKETWAGDTSEKKLSVNW